MTKHRAPRRTWTPADDARLRELHGTLNATQIGQAMGRTRSAIRNRSYNIGLRHSPEQAHAMVTSSLFAKGHTPWNKHLSGWQAGGRSAETRFQPGQKPHTTMAVGSLRLNKAGHLQRKISERPGNASQRWRCVAELVWVEAHGPVPAKHMVVFRPGRFSNVLEQITLDAVECISMAENARRNHPRNRHPMLGKLTQLKGAITRQVNRITREHAERHKGTP